MRPAHEVVRFNTDMMKPYMQKNVHILCDIVENILSGQGADVSVSSEGMFGKSAYETTYLYEVRICIASYTGRQLFSMRKTPFQIKRFHCGGRPFPTEVLTGESASVFSDFSGQIAIFHQTTYLRGNIACGRVM